MVVSFKLYAINFVDFVFDCYSHITSYVFQVFASCTHYRSYSLLNIVHVIVCVFGLTNQVWKYLEFYAKHILMLKNLKGQCLKILILGKLGLKLMFLKKHFISYSCILFIKFNALRSFCIKFAMFFRNMFFPEFRSIKAVFRLIEIVIKISVNLYLFWSVLDWCWISGSIFDWSNLIFDQSKVI